MSLTCYSCGRLCSAPRTPAMNRFGRKVWIGPDCYRNAAKGGVNGLYNEKMDTHVFTPEVWAVNYAEAWADEGSGEPEDEDSEG